MLTDVDLPLLVYCQRFGCLRQQTWCSPEAMEDDVIVIQVGQCGNQVGASFLESAARHRRSGRASCRFFRACGDKLVARSVLVDMEPKVFA